MQVPFAREISYPPGHTAPLTAHQRYMLNYQLSFPHCMLNNTPTLISFPRRSVEPEKLRAACEQVFRGHPSYALVHSFDEEGSVIWKYRPDIPEEIPITEVDDEAFLSNAFTLVRPFSLVDSCLYHCEIYAGEKNTYLFLDLYHTVNDGRSLMITLRDILAVMKGDTCKPDGYLDYLSDCGRMLHSAEQEKAEALFQSLYGEKNYVSIPRFDREGQTDQRMTCVKHFGMTQQDWEVAAEQRGITPNQSLVAACLAALSEYNHEKNVMVNWSFHGRDSKEKQDMTGLLLGNLPVGTTVGPGTSIRELLDEVHEKCEQGKAYGWLSPGVQGNRPGENDRIAVLYQNHLRLPPDAPEGTRISYLFDALTGQVNCFNILADQRENAAERVELLFVCNRRYYKYASMECFAEIFCKHLKRILSAEENARVLEDKT